MGAALDQCLNCVSQRPLSDATQNLECLAKGAVSVFDPSNFGRDDHVDNHARISASSGGSGVAGELAVAAA